MDFVLQFIAGDEGAVVSVCQFHNVVHAMHTAAPALL